MSCSLILVTSAKCEVRSVIQFLNAKKVIPIEIHRQLSEIDFYGKKMHGRKKRSKMEQGIFFWP